MKWLAVILLVIGTAMFPTSASSDGSDDFLAKAMADKCLTMDEINIIEAMPPNESTGIRALTDTEVSRLNKLVGKDVTEDGGIKVWVSFYQEPLVRIFGIDTKTGCFDSGGFVNLQAAKTFLEQGL